MTLKWSQSRLLLLVSHCYYYYYYYYKLRECHMKNFKYIHTIFHGLYSCFLYSWSSPLISFIGVLFLEPRLVTHRGYNKSHFKIWLFHISNFWLKVIDSALLRGRAILMWTAHLVKSNRQCAVEGPCHTDVDCTFAVSVSVSVTQSVVRKLSLCSRVRLETLGSTSQHVLPCKSLTAASVRRVACCFHNQR